MPLLECSDCGFRSIWVSSLRWNPRAQAEIDAHRCPPSMRRCATCHHPNATHVGIGCVVCMQERNNWGGDPTPCMTFVEDSSRAQRYTETRPDPPPLTYAALTKPLSPPLGSCDDEARHLRADLDAYCAGEIDRLRQRALRQLLDNLDRARFCWCPSPPEPGLDHTDPCWITRELNAALLALREDLTR